MLPLVIFFLVIHLYFCGILSFIGSFFDSLLNDFELWRRVCWMEHNPSNWNFVRKSFISFHFNSLQMYQFFIARFPHHRTLHSNFLCRNAFSLFFNSRSFSVSNTNHHHQPGNFTLSTLVNSCGLSPETALKLSKRLQIKNPNGPNAVVQLLTNHGFSDSQLRSYIKKHPLVLLSDAQKTLLPKIQFLQSIGVSTTDLPKILIGNTSFLSKSLDKHLIPRYEVIRSLVCNDKEVVSALKHGSWNLHCGWAVNDAVLNIEVLRNLGVPQGCISLLVSNFPGIAFTKHSIFVEAVNSVKEIGFDPSKSNFVLALQVFAKMNKDIWESRFKIFNKWGWSRDICLSAFLKHPQYMMISEKKIIKAMNFLVNDVGVSPEEIAKRPGMLNRNLEKTFIPRWAVVKILKSRGLIKSDLRISSVISISEKKFLERYVTRFQKDVSVLLDAYNGHMSDWSSWYTLNFETLNWLYLIAKVDSSFFMIYTYSLMVCVTSF